MPASHPRPFGGVGIPGTCKPKTRMNPTKPEPQTVNRADTFQAPGRRHHRPGRAGGFYAFANHSLLARVIGLLAAAGAAVAIALKTRTRRGNRGVRQGARSELRKVVWPTRAETTQTTLIVIAMVVIMGVLLVVRRTATVAGSADHRLRSDSMAMRWYVVQAYSVSSNTSSARCWNASTVKPSPSASVRFWCPPRKSWKCATDRSVKNDRKILSGLRAGTDGNGQRTWHLVRSVPKGARLHWRTSDKPAPISGKEAQTILQRIQDRVDKPKAQVLYEPGEMVRVTDGPFNDFEGVVEEVNYEKAGCASV